MYRPGYWPGYGGIPEGCLAIEQGGVAVTTTPELLGGITGAGASDVVVAVMTTPE